VSQHIIDFERVTAWHAEWDATHSERWRATGGHDKNGQRLYRPALPMKPLRIEPPSASVIRELELLINGRVLSPAPKETP
jgi:hypothetical protein